MYTLFQYIRYIVRAVGAHSLHSPFVFTLFDKVIKNASTFRIEAIEETRRSLLKNYQIIDVVDFKYNTSTQRTVSSIAKRSSSTLKFSAFLHLLINEIKAKTVVETGTSLGINTLYLAHTTAHKVCTLEASQILSELAKKQFIKHKKDGIILEFGKIDQTFIPTLIKHQPDFVFLDADHRGSIVKKQVDQILELCPKIKCIAIHDIYWSVDMTQAWVNLIKDPRIPLTVDIFQAGLLFPKKGMEKQHFTLRF
jgi:predicted O-methyltransferase YrrM